VAHLAASIIITCTFPESEKGHRDSGARLRALA